MKYKVYIQENYAGTIESDNTGTALAVVASKIQSKEFTVPNPNISPNIRIEPSNE